MSLIIPIVCTYLAIGFMFSSLLIWTRAIPKAIDKEVGDIDKPFKLSASVLVFFTVAVIWPWIVFSGREKL